MSQSPSTKTHFDVVVIGFGPSGAFAASMLGSRNLRTLAVDRQKDVYDKPRAIAIDHEILRHFDNLGVADRVLPHVAPFPASEHFGAEGQLIRRIDMVPEPYPLGYTPSMVFSQPPVESALRQHARTYANVEVALGTELLSFHQDDHKVTLHLRGDDEAMRTVTADFVIACDGATSIVRQALGIELEDLVFDEPWLVVDVLVNDDALGKLPDTAAQYCDPARPTTFIIGPKTHRRWEIMLLPGEDPREMEKPDEVWRLLAKWLTSADATLWRASSYRFHALVARDWRRGRVFLAGDAAHQQPPFIGQGMCQGLRDVANLVWRLDRVIGRRSGPHLLDTYGTERGAHVRELTGRIKAIGHVICERDPDAAKARDARVLAEGGGYPRTITRQEIVPPLSTGFLTTRDDQARGRLFPQPWIETRVGRQRLDAALGAGWRLVLDARRIKVAPDDVLRDLAGADLKVIALAGKGAPEEADTFVECDGVVQAWFSQHECIAAIVRPDHYVFGSAASTSALATLASELSRRLH